MLSGRDFTAADGYGKRAVIVVGEGTARRFFPNQDPIGRHITLTMMSKEPAEIVGVVREIKMGSLDASDAESETVIYAPFDQLAFGGATIVMRTATEPAAHTRALIDAVRAVDPEQPVLDITTMEEVVEESLGQRPFAMMLLATFVELLLLHYRCWFATDDELAQRSQLLICLRIFQLLHLRFDDSLFFSCFV